MRVRLLMGTVLSIVALMMVTFVGAAPTQKTAVVRFLNPTIIAGTAVLGPVVFEHDDAKMARGEPCTTVYALDRRTNRQGNVIVEFMCLPHARPVASQFEATVSRTSPAGPQRLMEYQFAGEREGHGVPFQPDHAH
jgi:hypothetical protein